MRKTAGKGSRTGDGTSVNPALTNSLSPGGKAAAEGPAALTPTEPAADLTPEQAQWWRDNQHLARWVPGRGFQIAGVNGYFDPAGHLRPDTGVAQVSYNEPADNSGSSPVGGGYDPVARAKGTAPSSGDVDLNKLTWWERITGNPNPSSDDATLTSKMFPWMKKEKSESKARALQMQGDQAFQAKKYDEAAVAFGAAAGLWPDSLLEEDAMFMRAESLFFATEYPLAFNAYEVLLTKYKRSRHLERAVAREYVIGQYWFQLYDFKPEATLQPNFNDKTRPRLDTLGYAIKAMEKVRLNDPTGPLADDSVMATANSYYLRHNYTDADYHYTLLRREYPKSPHQYEAHLLGIQSKLHIYQGPDYDSAPLKGAAELIDQTLKQFVQTPPDERQRLLELKEKIATARAERDWQAAQYYEAHEYYGAARMYYRQMMKEYANTKVATAAGERLAAIGDKPSDPAPRLTWISGLIPEPKDPKRLAIKDPAATGGGTVQR
ncbi:MAG: outer membrane protein assembly factor BamD [Planctomycetia bacterium]|nr:outer membrane protein assembly factor BamD [Planctomycetia bacterium]